MLIINSVQNDIELFLHFDNEHSIFQLLIEKNLKFGEVFVQRLIVLINSVLEKTSDGLYSENLGNFHPIFQFSIHSMNH